MCSISSLLEASHATRKFNDPATVVENTMARYVHPEVRSLHDEPDVNTSANLVLVLQEGATAEIEKRIEQFSGHVRSKLHADVIVVTIPETEIQAFIQTPLIESVSLDGGMEVLSSGNF